MGIQSSCYLTREAAERQFVAKMLEKDMDSLIRYVTKVLEAQAALMSDKELEDKLESTFDHYIISDNGDPDEFR